MTSYEAKGYILETLKNEIEKQNFEENLLNIAEKFSVL